MKNTKYVKVVSFLEIAQNNVKNADVLRSQKLYFRYLNVL